MYFRWVLGWPYYIYGLLRLFQHIWLTYVFWMGGRLIFFNWWFGMLKGCGGTGSCALHVVVKDGLGSSVWQLMNQGSFAVLFRGRSGVVQSFGSIFSAKFHKCRTLTEALYLICCSCLCEKNSLLATLGGLEPSSHVMSLKKIEIWTQQDHHFGKNYASGTGWQNLI